MKTFFSVEDIETVFLDAFDRGKKCGLFSNQTAENNWQEYKQSNPTVFQSQASKPVIDKKPDELLCPDCGSKMISRKGQYGSFWGCSTFPKCRGTRDSNGMSKAEREADKLDKEISKYEGHAEPAKEGEVRFRRK